MKTCNNCLANKVCDHNKFGFENCNNFLGPDITGDDTVTCKDCLCYDACGYHIDEETTMTINECSRGFKHKSQYVKLPAFIGQPVWLIKPLQKYLHEERKWETFGYEVESGKVSMLQQKADKSWKIRVTRKSYVEDYTIDEFNKKLFTTEKAAIEEYNRRIKELSNEI